MNRNTLAICVASAAFVIGLFWAFPSFMSGLAIGAVGGLLIAASSLWDDDPLDIDDDDWRNQYVGN